MLFLDDWRRGSVLGSFVLQVLVRQRALKGRAGLSSIGRKECRLLWGLRSRDAKASRTRKGGGGQGVVAGSAALCRYERIDVVGSLLDGWRMMARGGIGKTVLKLGWMWMDLSSRGLENLSGVKGDGGIDES